MTKKKAQPKKSLRILAAFAAISGMAVLAIILHHGSASSRTNPVQIAGKWLVTNHDGQSHGTLTFSADGEFTDGEYIGHWSVEGGSIHVRCWDDTPTSKFDNLFPKIVDVELIPQWGKDNNILCIQGESVRLTRFSNAK